MGDFIICSGKRATQPYRMNYENRAIYRMEELCYYMREHLFLIDGHLITKELFAWIGEELSLKQLQKDLLECLKIRKSAAACAMLILEESGLYTDRELEDMEKKLAFYAGLKDEERQKLLADHLLEVGLDRKALYLYLDLCGGVRSRKLSTALLSSVCYNAGRIYAGQFCLPEAADMFARAFETGQKQEALSAYYVMLDAMLPEQRSDYTEHAGCRPEPDEELKQRIIRRIELDKTEFDRPNRFAGIREVWKNPAKRAALWRQWLDDYIFSVTFH